MAVVLIIIFAVLLLTASVAFDPEPLPTWLRVVLVLAQWTGPVIVILLVSYVARRRLIARLQGYLVEIAGPSLVRSMAPRTVLGALLPWIYGERVSHQDVLTGVLGGAGRDSAGSDTAVSRNTIAHVRLESISETLCVSELTWTHEFSGVRNNHRFVVFATCDRDIASLVMSERVFPLFELWLVGDEDQLEDFVPTLRDNLKVGITYRDSDGHTYTVAPRRQDGEEVALRAYDRFVRLHDGVDRKNLRIVQLDLHDLANDDHVVAAVESLTLNASTIAPFELGYVAWSPPHPCFMRTITFDVHDLAHENEELVFLVVSSTIKSSGLPLSGWTPFKDTIEVEVDSWMMPGHGVTLLWRPINGVEPRYAPESG